MKLLPAAVMVVGPLPATAAEGEILLRVGVPAVTARFMIFEVHPPSEAFETPIGNCSTWLRSLALSATVSCVLLTNVVDRPLPLTVTCESAKKFVPFNVTFCAGLPTRMLVGEIPRKIGMFDEL